MREVLSPAGVPLTAEEQSVICTRHPVNRHAVLTRDGEMLAAEWPAGKYADEVMNYAVSVACGEIVSGVDRQ